MKAKLLKALLKRRRDREQALHKLNETWWRKNKLADKGKFSEDKLVAIGDNLIREDKRTYRLRRGIQRRSEGIGIKEQKRRNKEIRAKMSADHKRFIKSRVDR